MSKFTPSNTIEIDFDGDKVSFEFSRLLNEQLVRILPYFQSTDLQKGLANTARLLSEQGEVIQKSIKSMKGLVDASGVEIKLPDAIKEAYFMPLFDQFVGELLRVSIPRGDQIKKSEPPSPAAS